MSSANWEACTRRDASPGTLECTVMPTVRSLLRKRSRAVATNRYSSGDRGHPWRTPASKAKKRERKPCTMEHASVPVSSSCTHCTNGAPAPSASSA
ncbi:MAG: hypothetical protein RJB26_2658 [Pseudomonadota bacterium]